jgi:tRNA A-37 threonylcarbamoyl transferase component Bud32
MAAPLRDCYNLKSTPAMDSAVHRDWVEPLGDLQALFDELAAGDGTRSGRAGQGYTSLRQVAGAGLFVKFYLPGRINRRLRDLAGWKRARREWESNCRADELGIRPATIVAALTHKRFLGCRHLVLTLPAPGLSVKDLLRQRREDQAARDELLALVGKSVARWHRAGFRHAHLNVQHLFLDDAGEFTVIDFEAARFHRPIPERARLGNLRQMRDSLRKTLREDVAYPVFLEAYEKEWRGGA